MIAKNVVILRLILADGKEQYVKAINKNYNQRTICMHSQEEGYYQVCAEAFVCINRELQDIKIILTRVALMRSADM
jgi:hypothetical protein